MNHWNFASIMEKLDTSQLSVDFEHDLDDQEDNVYIARIRDKDGKELGHVRAVEDKRIGAYMVKKSEIYDLSLRGQGLGTMLYAALNEFLKKNKNSVLASDIFRSDEAEALWRKLLNKGKASYPHEYPGIRPKKGEVLDYYKMESKVWKDLAEAFLIEAPTTPTSRKGIQYTCQE